MSLLNFLRYWGWCIWRSFFLRNFRRHFYGLYASWKEGYVYAQQDAGKSYTQIELKFLAFLYVCTEQSLAFSSVHSPSDHRGKICRPWIGQEPGLGSEHSNGSWTLTCHTEDWLNHNSSWQRPYSWRVFILSPQLLVLWLPFDWKTADTCRILPAGCQ
jgi:hypothetical protein